MTARTWGLSLAVAIVMATAWIAGERRAAMPVLRSAHSAPASQVPDQPVLVTMAGKTFHRDGCAYIHGPGIREAGGQAVADGYTPCTRCLPRR